MHGPLHIQSKLWDKPSTGDRKSDMRHRSRVQVRMKFSQPRSSTGRQRSAAKPLDVGKDGVGHIARGQATNGLVSALYARCEMDPRRDSDTG